MVVRCLKQQSSRPILSCESVLCRFKSGLQASNISSRDAFNDLESVKDEMRSKRINDHNSRPTLESCKVSPKSTAGCIRPVVKKVERASKYHGAAACSCVERFQQPVTRKCADFVELVHCLNGINLTLQCILSCNYVLTNPRMNAKILALND